MNIARIGDIFMIVITSWNESLTVLENVVNISVKILGTIEGAFAQTALKYATMASAGLANLANGQAATVDTVTIGSVKYSLVLVKDGSPAAQSLGL